MTVRGGILQFVGESLPRSWSHKRLHSVLPYLHEDRAVTRPRVEDLPFPLQRARFPSDGSARSRHIFIDEQVCSLQLPGVAHNCKSIPPCRTPLLTLKPYIVCEVYQNISIWIIYIGTFRLLSIVNNLKWLTRSNAFEASKKQVYTLLLKSRYFRMASLKARMHISVLCLALNPN